jgi:hypothetical protein
MSFTVKAASSGDASTLTPGSGAWTTSAASDMAQLVIQFAAPTRIQSLAFESGSAAFCELFVTNASDASVHSAKASTLLMPIATLSLLPPSTAARRHRFDSHSFKPLIAAQTWKFAILVLTQPFHATPIGLAKLAFNADSPVTAVGVDDSTVALSPSSVSVAAVAVSATPSSASVPAALPLMTSVRACFSGLVGGARTAARKTLTDLGAEYAASWDDKCTHLVATALVASDKQTGALAKGVPIVSPKWLDACKAAGARVDEAPFLLTAPVVAAVAAPPPVAVAMEADTESITTAEKRAASSPPGSPVVVKKAKKVPAKATAKAPVGPYEKAVEGGKKLVKTASNRYILEDVAAGVATAATAAAATSSTSTKAELTDELTEPISAELLAKASKASSTTTTATMALSDDTVPLIDSRLGKGAPLHELPDLFGGRRVFFLFADGLSHEAQRVRGLARAFGAHVDDFVEDETAFLVTDLPFDKAMAGAREDNEELQIVTIAWFNDSLRIGRLQLPVSAKHRVPGDDDDNNADDEE